MAEQWSLPPLLNVPIACHHAPAQAEEDLQPISRVVHVAWRFAEVFLEDKPVDSVVVAKDAADQMLDLTATQVERLLEKVSKSVHEVADVFDINIGERADTQHILDQARDVLLEMTLKSQRMASQLEDRNRRLRKAATTDPLTGLANRALFDKALAEEFGRAKTSRRDLGLLFIDADHFKNTNDTYGHTAGDKVLKELARSVGEVCTDGIIVGRYGGEEIICILLDTDLSEAVQLAEAIRRSVAEAVIEHDGAEISITVSIGVAGMKDGQFFESGEQLVNYGDRALYAAKRDGRNLVRICCSGEPVAKT